MTRYLLIVDFESGAARRRWRSGCPRRSRPTSTTTGLHEELVASGELVEAEVLAGPDLAKVVTFDGVTAPVVTDGPFQEFKEWLAGYQIVDVESEARALEIAARISAVPGRAAWRAAADPGAPDDGGSAPSNVAEMEAFLEHAAARAERAARCRGPAARAGAAGPRRARAPVRRLRRRRGRRAGGAARRRAALAARRRPGEPARLAAADRRAAADRPVAQRAVAAAPREHRRRQEAPPRGGPGPRTTRWPCCSCAATRR